MSTGPFVSLNGCYFDLKFLVVDSDFSFKALDCPSLVSSAAESNFIKFNFIGSFVLTVVDWLSFIVKPFHFKQHFND